MMKAEGGMSDPGLPSSFIIPCSMFDIQSDVTAAALASPPCYD
jgi:hypothetical protein